MEQKKQLEDCRQACGSSLATLTEQDSLTAEIESVDNQIREKKRQKRSIERFITGFENAGTVYSSEGWSLMVERVDAYRDRMRFKLTSGVVVEV